MIKVQTTSLCSSFLEDFQIKDLEWKRRTLDKIEVKDICSEKTNLMAMSLSNKKKYMEEFTSFFSKDILFDKKIKKSKRSRISRETRKMVNIINFVKKKLIHLRMKFLKSSKFLIDSQNL